MFAPRARGWHKAAMGIVLAFLLGITNFAAQGAVLAIRHPMFARLSPSVLRLGRGMSLGIEFALLLAALFAAERGLTGWLFAYTVYTAVNVAAAWILTRQRP